MITQDIEEIEVLVNGEYYYASCTAHWEENDDTFTAPYGSMFVQGGDVSIDLNDVTDIKLSCGTKVTKEIEDAVFATIKEKGYNEK